ncbi:MAG: carboxymuconolactone decarboxylase family protein [Planctomycetota bacterium]|nr:carboxymuconolactone decarboxylase family protein [Planctomycetota bacterium]MDA1114081.1 carboxymuconolactone decarboxylase family protein [Planctomycetota bacterium]
MSQRLPDFFRIVSALHHGRDEDLVSASEKFIQGQESQREVLQDLLRVCHLFYGFPRIVRALTLISQQLGTPSKLSEVCIAEDPLQKGEVVFREVYGRDANPVLTHLDRVDPQFRAWVLRHAYGTAFATTCLSLDERERLSVMTLVATGCWQQARSHMRACLRHGVSLEDLLQDLVCVEWLDREQCDLATTCLHAEAELG